MSNPISAVNKSLLLKAKTCVENCESALNQTESKDDWSRENFSQFVSAMDYLDIAKRKLEGMISSIR